MYHMTQSIFLKYFLFACLLCNSCFYQHSTELYRAVCEWYFGMSGRNTFNIRISMSVFEALDSTALKMETSPAEMFISLEWEHFTLQLIDFLERSVTAADPRPKLMEMCTCLKSIMVLTCAMRHAMLVSTSQSRSYCEENRLRLDTNAELHPDNTTMISWESTDDLAALYAPILLLRKLKQGIAACATLNVLHNYPASVTIEAIARSTASLASMIISTTEPGHYLGDSYELYIRRFRERYCEYFFALAKSHAVCKNAFNAFMASIAMQRLDAQSLQKLDVYLTYVAKGMSKEEMKGVAGKKINQKSVKKSNGGDIDGTGDGKASKTTNKARK